MENKLNVCYGSRRIKIYYDGESIEARTMCGGRSKNLRNHIFKGKHEGKRVN